MSCSLTLSNGPEVFLRPCGFQKAGLGFKSLKSYSYSVYNCDNFFKASISSILLLKCYSVIYVCCIAFVF